MFRASPEQAAAFEHARNENSGRIAQSTKSKSISGFLAFAGRIVGSDPEAQIANAIETRRFYTRSAHQSRAIKAPTLPHSEEVMGMSVTAYRIGYGKLRGRRIETGESRINTADVNVGVLFQGTKLTPELVGSQVVLRVVEFPEAMYFAPLGEVALRSIEPDTEAWGEANNLIEELFAQEKNLTK